MKRVLALACCAGLLACRRSPAPVAAAPPPSDPKVVADWNGGSATLTDVEGALLSMSSNERLSREGDIVKTYKDVSQERALAQILVPKGPGGAAASLETSAPEQYQHALVQLYSRDVALRGRNLTVEEDELKAFYRAHPGEFHRAARVLLYNIYRRRREGEDAGAPAAFLAGLRKRVQGGEKFTELARAHSDSETRANDGQVGWTERGAMAPSLEKVAFSLKEGEVSQPVPVPSGAVLLYADKAVPEKNLAYEDVKAEIRRHLERQKLKDALEKWAKDVPIPEGSLVLTRQQFKDAVATGKDDQPVLRIGGITATRADLTKGLPPQARATLQEPQIWEIYRQRLWNLLLLSEAKRSGYAERPETRTELERGMRRSLERKAVEDKLEARLQGDLAPQDAVLRAYYDDHPQKFMTPLKLRLRLLVIDKVPALGKGMKELEAARAELAAGKLTLEEAAQRLGGRVEDIGWREALKLEGLEDKERRYVLDLQSAGYTVPFQREGSLRLIQVAERQEPARRPYEQVRAEVLSTYLKEKKKELLDAAVQRVLADAHFRFFDDRVRAALAVTTPKASAPPGK